SSSLSGGMHMVPARDSATQLVTSTDASPATQIAIGWLILAPGTIVSVPAQHRLLIAVVEGGRLEHATKQGAIGEPKTQGAGDVAVIRDGLRDPWRAGDGGPTTVLLMEITTSPGDATPAGSQPPHHQGEVRTPTE